MNSFKANFRVLAVVLAGAFFVTPYLWADDSRLYRYIGEHGVVVIDDFVPPQYVRNGYDILASDGTYLSSVPRQLTEEEIRQQSRQRYLELEKEQLRRWDESLLLRYSEVEDIEAAEKRALGELQIRISILKSNLHTVKKQIEKQQQKAADFERRGQPVPEELASNISSLRIDIKDTEQAVEARRQEIKEAKASYKRDIERFVTLQDRVEFRRKAHHGASSRKKAY